MSDSVFVGLFAMVTLQALTIVSGIKDFFLVAITFVPQKMRFRYHVTKHSQAAPALDTFA